MSKGKKKTGKKTPMEELTKGYEKFIEATEQDPDGKDKFDKAIKKATKQRGSK
jgi:hypothetical protein